MKRIKGIGFICLIFSAVSAVSCLQEEVSQTQDQGMYFSFMASRENMKNKTIIVDNNKVEWVKGDQLVVFNGKGTDAGAVADDGQQFVDEKWERGWIFNGQTSGKSCLFISNSKNFDDTQENFLLVYPYNNTYYGNVELNRVRFWLPENQKAVKGTFDPAYCYAVAKANSLATTSDSPIFFNNVMALLKFTIPDRLAGLITEIAVWGKNGEHIAGEIICDCSGDVPVAAPYKKYYTDKSKGKTATCIADSNGMAPGDYYLVVCPGDFSSLVISATSKSGRKYRREKTSKFTFSGGFIYDMGEIEAETYNVNVNGVSELPYVFSLTNKSTSGNTAKYLTSTAKAVHYPDKKYAEGSLTDGNVGAVMTYRMAARTTADVYTWDPYWNEGRGSYNIPASSMISEDYEAGYGANFKLTVPMNMTMPESFSVTFGMNAYSGAFANWKIQYSNDDKTWYDGAQITLHGNAYCKYTVNITPEVTISDMLYLKWIPVGTTLSGSASPWKAQLRFWGGVVIGDLTKQTTPRPSGSIFFEAFDDMIGGVDYLHGGQENGLDKLGLLSDCYGQTIGSGNNPKAPASVPVTWNNLTCSLVAMRPGYAQIGHAKIHQASGWAEYQNYIGKITTPKLAEGTLTLSFKAMMYRNPLIGLTSSAALDNVTADEIIVNVIGGGTFEDGTTSKTISGVSYSAFNTYTLAVKDATADTQVEFTSPSSVPTTRWFIDDICVSK